MPRKQQPKAPNEGVTEVATPVVPQDAPVTDDKPSSSPVTKPESNAKSVVRLPNGRIIEYF